MNELLKRAIQGYRFNYYEEAIQTAVFSRQITLGEAYGALIYDYRKKETEAQKVQRVEISQIRTKAPAHKVKGYFKQIFRHDKLKFDIDLPKVEDSDEMTDTAMFLQSQIDSYGDDGEPLINYCENTALDYNILDPNCLYWVRYTVDEMGNEMFSPVIFDSDSVLDRKIKKGLVVYAVTMLSNSVYYSNNDQNNPKSGEKDIHWYYYFDKDVIQTAIAYDKDIAEHTDYYSQFADEQGNVNTVDVLTASGVMSFILIEDENPANETMVSRIGYKKDLTAKSKIYVTILDDASEEFRCLVYDGTAFDVSRQLHLFPKEIVYYMPCEYRDDNGADYCDGGHMHYKGTVCPSCKGSGEVIHLSGQDVIKIKLPTHDDPQPIAPKDFAHYVQMPFDIIEKQDELVKRATPQIIATIFGADMENMPQENGFMTATQVIKSADTTQNVLYEFTQAPKKMVKFTVKMMEQVKDISIPVHLEYPNHYNLESETELLERLKLSKDAGADPSITRNIEDKILIKQNRVNSNKATVTNLMRSFKPFGNVEKEVRVPYLLGLPENSLIKALSLNFDSITQDIINNQPEFILKSYDEQKEAVLNLARQYRDQATQENSIDNIRAMRSDLEALEGDLDEEENEDD